MNWNKIKNISGLKSVGILGFSAIVGNAISVIFWLYLANLLGPEKYGEINYLIAITYFASTISFVSGRYAIAIYTAKEVKIQSTLYLITIISSITAALVLFFLFNNIGMSFIVVGSVLFVLTTAELLGRKLFEKYSKYFIIQKILFVSFSISLYYLIGSQGIILGIGFSFIPFFYMAYKAIKGIKLDFKLLKTRRGFMINNYLVEIMEQFRIQIDILMIGPLFGFALLGNYHLGIQFFYILIIFPHIFLNYTLQADSRGRSTKELKLLAVIISVGLALIGFYIAPMIVPVIFPEYGDAINLIPILSLAIIPYTISYTYISKLLGQEKSKHVIIGSTITLIVLILGIITLEEIFGAQGLAFAVVFAYTAQALYMIGINYVSAKN